MCWSGARRKGIACAIGIFVGIVIAFGVSMAKAEPVRILAFGDSLTAGYGLDQSQSFPAQLGRALAKAGIEAEIINGGISGDTSAGGRARLAWSMADKPDAIIVELGANDGLRGLEPTQTEQNLDAIIAEAKANGLAVLLCGMLAPPNLGKEYGEEFRTLFSRLANKHRVLFYRFFLEGVAAYPELNQADGIHPNAKGVSVIVDRILPSVRKLIDQAAGRV